MTKCNELTPGNVRSNDGLGPLPDAAFTYERHPGGFHEPERVGAYMAGQMKAYAAEQVAIERNRLLESLTIAMQHSAWDGVLQLDDALRNIADALA